MKKIVIFLILACACAIAFAGWNEPTSEPYVIDTLRGLTPDTFTFKIYEGTDLVCFQVCLDSISATITASTDSCAAYSRSYVSKTAMTRGRGVTGSKERLSFIFGDGSTGNLLNWEPSGCYTIVLDPLPSTYQQLIIIGSYQDTIPCRVECLQINNSR